MPDRTVGPLWYHTTQTNNKMATTPCITDTASDFVQHCLGFNSTTAKLNALRHVHKSLSSANDDASSSPTTALASQWRQFMEGSQNQGDEFDDDTTDANDFMLRDSLIQCLVESCHPSEDNHDDDAESDEEIFEMIQLSFLSLSHLISLRCTTDSGKSNCKSNVAPIFGYNFVTSIATDIVEALKMDFVCSSVTDAACTLLMALLRPDRPRNEVDIATVRDAILIPASELSSYAGSVACVAEVVSASVIEAVVHSVPFVESGDEEELSMRRETAALTKLQDLRDVIANVGSVCVEGLSSSDGGQGGDGVSCCQRIMKALQDIHAIAAYAVESQLETLLDDKAAVIIARLGTGSEEDVDETMDQSEGDVELEEQEVATLAPLYASIAKPPVMLSSVKELETALKTILEQLNETDAEYWDERMNALIDIERILAGGVAWMGQEARHVFIERLRKMPIADQFVDLRSQITHHACRVVIATSFEFRDYVREDAVLGQAMSHFVECCVPSILRLCMSGTRLMATSGMNCLQSLAAVGGSVGYSRLIPVFCDDITAKKVHKNRKRGSVLSLTAALRVWDSSCFTKHGDIIAKAAKEAAGDRDPSVREESRKLYWAMMACDKTSRAAEELYPESSRDMRNLRKVKDEIDAEWEEEGVMGVLVQTGVLGTAAPAEPTKRPATTKPKAAASTSIQPPRTMPPRYSTKRPASAATTTTRATPAKNGRFSSTPVKEKEATPISKTATPMMRNSERKSMIPMNPPSSQRAAKLSSRAVNRDNGRQTPSASPVPFKSEEVFNPAMDEIKSQPSEEKENSVIETPRSKVVGFMGTPVANILARPSPLSVEKVRNSDDVLGDIVLMLSDTSSRQEQYLGIQALALFASEHSRHQSWDEKFSLVLNCLIGTFLVHLEPACVLSAKRRLL